jgi:hypothetical protein
VASGIRSSTRGAERHGEERALPAGYFPRRLRSLMLSGDAPVVGLDLVDDDEGAFDLCREW